MDLDEGEVLIEEIQSDWVRYARRAYEASSAEGNWQASI
jgi:hypothetical protein